MIIDCHGHFTTVPPAHKQWREAQLVAWEAGLEPPPYPHIADADITGAITQGQLAMMDERGIDVTIFSPQASAMGHHRGDAVVSREWTRRCNDLIARVIGLFPGRFAGVCQLPQSVADPIGGCVEELRRCVSELGFIGANLNPDPSGGDWNAPPLTDRSWYPLYDALVELDVPAMIHVSGSSNPHVHTTGAYYIAADTIAFMQLVQSRLFADFPKLRFVIPHGGGAAPYHWGRYRGLAAMLDQPPLDANVLTNVFFDTCVYHQPGIDLLCEVIPSQNILFGSEMIGAVRGVDSRSGHHFDDTRRYVEATSLDDRAKRAVFEQNIYRVYPRLGAVLHRSDPYRRTTRAAG
ncbi:MAG: amidohydrolase [Solirubrobacterales bacterium]|nr:amidohydrolase [Solirubrobacterales bacterium]